MDRMGHVRDFIGSAGAGFDETDVPEIREPDCASGAVNKRSACSADVSQNRAAVVTKKSSS
jgi:hypothetical protein